MDRRAALHAVGGSLTLSLALAIGLSPAAASEEAVDIAEEMGFSAPTSNAIEVRIWIQGALLIPRYLYRFREQAGVVEGQSFAWYGLQHTDDPALVARVSERNERITTSLTKSFCKSVVRRTRNLVWCPSPVSTDKEWTRVFRALPLRELWELPEQRSLGTPPCGVFDGGSVSIELVSAQRQHYVEYWNPRSCCPWPECKVAARVLDLVGALR